MSSLFSYTEFFLNVYPDHRLGFYSTPLCLSGAIPTARRSLPALRSHPTLADSLGWALPVFLSQKHLPATPTVAMPLLYFCIFFIFVSSDSRKQERFRKETIMIIELTERRHLCSVFKDGGLVKRWKRRVTGPSDCGSEAGVPGRQSPSLPFCIPPSAVQCVSCRTGARSPFEADEVVGPQRLEEGRETAGKVDKSHGTWNKVSF